MKPEKIKIELSSKGEGIDRQFDQYLLFGLGMLGREGTIDMTATKHIERRAGRGGIVKSGGKIRMIGDFLGAFNSPDRIQPSCEFQVGVVEDFSPDGISVIETVDVDYDANHKGKNRFHYAVSRGKDVYLDPDDMRVLGLDRESDRVDIVARTKQMPDLHGRARVRTIIDIKSSPPDRQLKKKEVQRQIDDIMRGVDMDLIRRKFGSYDEHGKRIG